MPTNRMKWEYNGHTFQRAVWVPEYTEDATYATPDHPYGTAGEAFGHEGHWTDPNLEEAA